MDAPLRRYLSWDVKSEKSRSEKNGERSIPGCGGHRVQSLLNKTVLGTIWQLLEGACGPSIRCGREDEWDGAGERAVGLHHTVLCRPSLSGVCIFVVRAPRSQWREWAWRGVQVFGKGEPSRPLITTSLSWWPPASHPVWWSTTAVECDPRWRWPLSAALPELGGHRRSSSAAGCTLWASSPITLGN